MDEVTSSTTVPRSAPENKPWWRRTGVFTVIVGLINSGVGLGFGVLEVVATKPSIERAMKMYTDLYGISGSTGYDVGLFMAAVLLFPAFLVVALGVGGAILFAIARRRSKVRINPYFWS